MNRIFILVTVILVALSGCIVTQGDKTLDARMQKLETRVDETQQAANQTKDLVEKNVGQMADSQVYFDNMRQEFEQMKGALDEQKYAKNRTADEYKNLKQYLDDRFAKIEKRMVALEKKAGIAPADAVSEPLPETLEGVPVAKKSEEDAYQEAFLEFKKQRYDNAKKLFATFQKDRPQSAKAHDAQFYRGECEFMQKNYTNAILLYDELTSKYPKSPHVPQAILNQAIAFEQLGQKFDAKLFYEKVISQYPNSEEAKIAKKKLSLMQK
jgi:tol-pal system protein YbgF